jgi:hypothetical protein
MTGACATPGGIAVENRHILHVLARLAEERAAQITAPSFLIVTRYVRAMIFAPAAPHKSLPLPLPRSA